MTTLVGRMPTNRSSHGLETIISQLASALGKLDNKNLAADVSRVLGKFLGAEQVYLFSYDAACNEFVCNQGAGAAQGAQRHSGSFMRVSADGPSIVAEAARTAQLALIGRASSSPKVTASAEPFEFAHADEAVVVAPIQAPRRQDVIAVLVVTRHGPPKADTLLHDHLNVSVHNAAFWAANGFTQSECNIVQLIASQLGYMMFSNMERQLLTLRTFRFQSLTSAAVNVSWSVGLPQLMDTLGKQAANLVMAQSALVLLFDPYKQTFWTKNNDQRVEISIQPGSHVDDVVARLAKGQHGSGTLLEWQDGELDFDAGCPFLFSEEPEEDFAEDEEEREAVETDTRRMFRTASIMCAPILDKSGSLLGIVRLANKLQEDGDDADDDDEGGEEGEKPDRGFTADDEDLFARLITVVAPSAQALQRVGRALRCAESLHRLSHHLPASHAEICREVETNFCELVSAERARVLFVDEDSGELFTVPSDPDAQEERVSLTYAEDKTEQRYGFAVSVVNNGGSLRMDESTGESQLWSFYRPASSVLVVPVLHPSSGKLLAVVEALNKLRPNLKSNVGIGTAVMDARTRRASSSNVLAAGCFSQWDQRIGLWFLEQSAAVLDSAGGDGGDSGHNQVVEACRPLTISETPDVPTLLRALTDRTRRLVHCEEATFYAIDPARNQTVSLNPEGGTQRSSCSVGAVGYAIQTGKMLKIQGMRTKMPDLPKTLLGAVRSLQADHSNKVDSLFLSPMKTPEGEVAGAVMLVNRRDARHFDAADSQAIGAIATQGAIALKRIALHADAIAASESFYTLFGPSLELPRACARIVKRAGSLVSASTVRLVSAGDRASHVFFVQGESRPNGGEIEPYQLPPPTEATQPRILAECYDSKLPQNVPNTKEDDRFSDTYDQPQGTHTKALLYVPILGPDGAQLAVLQVFNKTKKMSFTENDVALLQQLSTVAATALTQCFEYDRLTHALEEATS